jgi:hypothetical protein
MNATNAATPLLISSQWYDSETRCTIIVSRPSDEPELWTDYLAGAERSYRKHGVEMALDFAEIADGCDTALFFAAVDDSGKVIGGTRAKGPYRCADDSHAVVEWAGQPGLRSVRKMIDDRVPFGIAEMKTAWVTDDPSRSKAMTTTLARTALHSITVLGIQFSMATSAAHVLDRWRSSGGVVVSKIPATPYPDERYRTKIMFWDRRTFARHAQPQQILKTIEETSYLTPDDHWLPTVPALSSGAGR